jgi:2-polyprenyl-3-methyl-5-hydroxy-6-metoxy-1,4-benzoquinol methylase
MAMPIDPMTFCRTAHGVIYACPACQFGFVFPRPTASDTEAFYELSAYYTRGSTHLAQVPPPRFLSRLRTHLAWRADAGRSIQEIVCGALPAGAAILDIGCGDGSLIDSLSRLGYHAIGVERDAQTLSRRDRKVLEGSAESLPPELGTFDGIVFSHVLEHLVDPVMALTRAAALLKSHGLVFCEVPNNESAIAEQCGLAWWQLDTPRHLNFFTERSLIRIAEAAHLKVRESYFVGYCRYYSDSIIATEQRIFDHLPEKAGPAVRNSALRSWLLLARTAFAARRRKYDSVGIVAGRAAVG